MPTFSSASLRQALAAVAGSSSAGAGRSGSQAEQTRRRSALTWAARVMWTPASVSQRSERSFIFAKLRIASASSAMVTFAWM
ncbi:hypothetical protein [Oceanibium sediminis]|uniref:hypothetical protein n=1 Tax=Oceanibium sediminis TaxID=2026339 RepID=UPI000DD35806|nr:hypothetical protein [Oceanibium sediminis]